MPDQGDQGGGGNRESEVDDEPAAQGGEADLAAVDEDETDAIVVEQPGVAGEVRADGDGPRGRAGPTTAARR
jgi:hypothetical protein